MNRKQVSSLCMTFLLLLLLSSQALAQGSFLRSLFRDARAVFTTPERVVTLSREFPESVVALCRTHLEECEAAAGLIEEGNWIQAELLLRQVKQTAPECPLVPYYLGAIRYYQRNDRQALAYFNGLAERHPEMYQIYYYRGWIHYDRGLLTVALDEFHRVILYNNTVASGYVLNLIRPILQQETGGSEVKMDSLIQEISYRTGAAFTRGVLAWHNEQYEFALEQFRFFTSQWPEHVGAWLMTGRCYESLDRFHEALHAYSRAISLDSRFDQAYFHRGLLYWNARNLRAGCIDLARARGMNNPGARQAFRELCR